MVLTMDVDTSWLDEMGDDIKETNHKLEVRTQLYRVCKIVHHVSHIS